MMVQSTEQRLAEFDEQYYKSGNYTNYLARAPRYFHMARELTELLSKIGVLHGPYGGHDQILDFGCGVGFLTAGFHRQGYSCSGYDPSKWAIEYGKSTLGISCLSTRIYTKQSYRLMMALDVFEHMPVLEVRDTLRATDARYLVVRIPLGTIEDGFTLEVSQQDPTHITPLTRQQWIDEIRGGGYQYLVPLDLSTIYDTEDVFCAIFRSTK